MTLGLFAFNFFDFFDQNLKIEKVHGNEVDTCNTTDSLRKATTCRIESHIRHVVYRIFTVYDSARNVVYRGFTASYLGRVRSHSIAYTISGFPMELSNNFGEIAF